MAEWDEPIDDSLLDSLERKETRKLRPVNVPKKSRKRKRAKGAIISRNKQIR